MVKDRRVVSLTLGLSLMAILLMGVVPSGATGAGTYNNVQIFIQTSVANFTGTYLVTAYNSTGSSISTYQSPYPAASFELPSGSYIFTVSATQQTQNVCLTPGVAQGTASSGVSSGSGSVSTPTTISGTVTTTTGQGGAATIVYPPCYVGGQEVEYGYSSQKITASTTINISTQPMANIPTSTLTIHVGYANGTAASGASVYASIVGGQWYDGIGVVKPLATTSATAITTTQQTVSLSGQTGKDGNVKLIVPTVPLEVTAWSWVPINLPTQPTTTQVTIGGQKVNVTVYWEPSYVGLAGSLLIVPPQNSGTITLHIQQSSYWVVPTPVRSVTGTAAASGTGASSAPTSATVTNGPGGVPAQLASQLNVTSAASTVAAAEQQIPATFTTTTTSVTTSTELVSTAPTAGSHTTSTAPLVNNVVLLTIVAALALGVASAGLVVVVRRRAEP